MKRWIVAALVLSFALLAPASDALARGRHHGGRFRYGFDFNFIIPLSPFIYSPYHSHTGYNYDLYSHPRYYRHWDYPIPLDGHDMFLLSRKTQHALENAPSGVKVKWLNHETAVGGYVIARPTFKNSLGQYCRDFERMIAFGRRSSRTYGTACRQHDGFWK